ncbi:hypothetical protein ES708_18654 [subsurface metagenome]
MVIEESISKAKEFLINQRCENGLWKDFDIRNYGILVDWITAYTGLALIKANTPKTQLKQTADELVRRQNVINFGWSCDERVVPDTDTTAFAIMFLSHFDFKKNIENAKKFIKNQQLSDGSFRTYQADLIAPYISDLTSEGWSGGIAEVTATASQALKGDKTAIEYLKKSVREDGAWNNYWYTKEIYSTAHCILALKDDNSANEIVEKAQNWLLVSSNLQCTKNGK